jgi:hypothetical protein
MTRRPAEAARYGGRPAAVLGALVFVAALGVTASLGAALPGERGGGEAVRRPASASFQIAPNVPYDGRFTFVRLSYEMPLGRFGGGFGGRSGPCYGGPVAWLHDYPCAERNLAHVLREVTLVEPYPDGGNILALDDPELFKYPIAYMSEPGHWRPTDAEAAALRAYLLKGGFLIFDDFRGSDWYGFEAGIRKALPEAELMRLDGSEPIFSAFFQIAPLETITGPYGGGLPEWWGIYENNDRSRRLMVVASFNNDLGDYWEYSGTGWYPMDMTNEALKLGINYMIYGMVN